MDIAHFTDPACPYAFSAEPARMQLRWHYGDQLTWRTVMIGLAEDGDAYERKGMTTTRFAKKFAALQREHGMPIDTSERSRLAGTVPACRAVVAVRLHEPQLEDAILRRLRVRTMSGELLDDQSTIDGAATDAGLDPSQVRAWCEEPETEAALRGDMAAARTPLPAAHVLDHKLSPSEDGGRRYSAPSYELHAGDVRFAVPGFQPWATYDAIVANLDPTIVRRASAQDVDEVLAWADVPLATAEVAAIRGIDIDAAREELEQAGATFDAVGEDGYWTAAA